MTDYTQILEDVYGKGRLVNINTNGSYFISNTGNPVILRNVILNKPGSSNTLTLYDGNSTSGRLLGVIDTSILRSLPYMEWCDTGIFAVLSGGTAADISITFKE